MEFSRASPCIYGRDNAYQTLSATCLAMVSAGDMTIILTNGIAGGLLIVNNSAEVLLLDGRRFIEPVEELHVER